VDCSRWRELASDYIEGTLLSPAIAEAMAAHARGCDSCRADEQALRAITREMNALPLVDPPLFFRENIMAAIERQQTQRGVGTGEPWWKSLFSNLPQLGRVAVGTTLAAGTVAAFLWGVLIPSGGRHNDKAMVAGPGLVPVRGLLPGATGSGDAAAQRQPRLRIARVTTVLPDGATAYDFSFWLENAETGTARFQLPDSEQIYRFNLSGAEQQTLRVPFSAVGDKQVVDLTVNWAAGGKAHTRHLLVPIPQSDAAPGLRQSFGLGESSIAEAAREIAVRYGRPVTLDDLPEDGTVRITAREEAADEVLGRYLSGLGMKVAASSGGILIEKAATAASPESTPPTP
jgi:hypothetical protein